MNHFFQRGPWNGVRSTAGSPDAPSTANYGSIPSIPANSTGKRAPFSQHNRLICSDIHSGPFNTSKPFCFQAREFRRHSDTLHQRLFEGRDTWGQTCGGWVSMGFQLTHFKAKRSSRKYLLQFSTICNTRGLEISRGKRHPLAGKICPLDAKICQCLFLKGLIEAMFPTQTSICLSKMWNHWLSFAPECTRFKAMQFTGAKRVVMRSTVWRHRCALQHCPCKQN